MKHKLEDISGWRMAEHGFPESRWTVISKDPEKPKNLICKCDCGTVKSTSDYNIRYGKSLSCGCRSRELITKTCTIDMTGWKMWEHGVPDSIYTVLRKDEETHGNWICQCACGTIKSVRGTALRSGNTKSCGCKYSQKIDMTGWIMKEHGVENSRIIILEEDPTYALEHKVVNSKNIYWKCQCECGNVFTTRGTSIRFGQVLSCGCLQKEASQVLGYDLIGMTFHNLTVIEKMPKRDKQKRVVWKCQCKCGTYVYLPTASITSENYPVYSCGCLKSKGESIIGCWLTNHNLDYKKEYTFSNFRTEKGGYPRFDFAIFLEGQIYLLEYQGPQHYMPGIKFGQYQRETTDALKKEYCKIHQYPLLEITYTDDIEEKLEEFFPTK